MTMTSPNSTAKVRFMFIVFILPFCWSDLLPCAITWSKVYEAPQTAVERFSRLLREYMNPTEFQVGVSKGAIGPEFPPRPRGPEPRGSPPPRQRGVSVLRTVLSISVASAATCPTGAQASMGRRHYL